MQTYDELMNQMQSASVSNDRQRMQLAINAGSAFLEAHAPNLNATGDTGDLTNAQVDAIGAAIDNLTAGIPVNYSSPLAAALDPAKVTKDLGDSAREALKATTEGLTKGLGSTLLKVGAIAVGVLLAFSIAAAVVKRA